MKRAALLLLIVGCTKRDAVAEKPTSDFDKPVKVVTPPPPARVPLHHRESAVCTKTEPDLGGHGRKGPIAGDACTTDGDCKKAKLGRCSSGACTYDSCRSDAECGKSICRCSEYGSQGYSCFEGGLGDCTTDASCGAGRFCSPSFETTCGPHRGVVGYWCHTAKDTCTDDSECKADGQTWGYCAFHPEVGHWACGYGVCKG